MQYHSKNQIFLFSSQDDNSVSGRSRGVSSGSEGMSHSEGSTLRRVLETGVREIPADSEQCPICGKVLKKRSMRAHLKLHANRSPSTFSQSPNQPTGSRFRSTQSAPPSQCPPIRGGSLAMQEGSTHFHPTNDVGVSIVAFFFTIMNFNVTILLHLSFD